MSQHIYNVWVAVQDGWQNVAIVLLGFDRATAWYRRRTAARREAERPS